MGFEKGGRQSLMATTATSAPTAPPTYPSSSKKGLNYDQLDKEMQKELNKEKPEGEGALNSLFQ